MLLRMMFILFLGLKLGGVIDWSWWLVSAPLMAMVVRFIIQSAIKQGLKLKRPWAIKFVTWLKD